ncbi:hypothetical protein HELRODRAFT_180147 [Helobdella robusta]|uniref:C-type lectin domain-containing protein n=1 Tax=Helobdella robusta TaxID=6412 RepID=T1FFI7_HELRO|nr:hypothetical protein HELRODRAFT_180147 [Helobdella robusta]ESN94801.1 hypothetical protein HELRODRAFT_180147 [Helobdella robusta]
MAQCKGLLHVLMALCFFALTVEGCLYGCFYFVYVVWSKFASSISRLFTTSNVSNIYILIETIIEMIADTCYSPTRKSISYWTAGHWDRTTNNFYWNRYTASINKTKIEFPAGIDVYLSNSNNNEDCLELVQNSDKFEVNDVSCNNLKIANSAVKLCSICQAL